MDFYKIGIEKSIVQELVSKSRYRSQKFFNDTQLYFPMNLTAVLVVSTKLEPSVISSAQFSSALVTGVPHVFNNAILSHSTHS